MASDTKTPGFTPAQIKKAASMRKKGTDWDTITASFGLKPSAVLRLRPAVKTVAPALVRATGQNAPAYGKKRTAKRSSNKAQTSRRTRRTAK
jgi:hypothetical protein